MALDRLDGMQEVSFLGRRWDAERRQSRGLSLPHSAPPYLWKGNKVIILDYSISSLACYRREKNQHTPLGNLLFHWKREAKIVQERNVIRILFLQKLPTGWNNNDSGVGMLSRRKINQRKWSCSSNMNKWNFNFVRIRGAPKTTNCGML